MSIINAAAAAAAAARKSGSKYLDVHRHENVIEMKMKIGAENERKPRMNII